MASKLCDSCKTTTATLFCRADSAFLCVGCDTKVHAANKLASRHARVWVCEVCEQAPAQVACKADAAVLCAGCDRDIHSANPLARRHERVPVTPFYDSAVKPGAAGNSFEGRRLSDVDEEANLSRDEVEAASWLLPNPNSKAIESPDLNSSQFVFPEMDTYLNLDYGSVDLESKVEEQSSPGADGVVPVESNSLQHPMANGSYFATGLTEAKSFSYGYNTHSASQSLSSSSMEVAVVPDGSAMNDISNPYAKPAAEPTTNQAVQISAADREARVLRYREKRKNRKFEKTIRYASRKAYAETRPRIKGRFAKRTDEVWGYGVVPTLG